ncbi:MAG: ABC transporter permease [Spirochaetaceae bacterium]|nr:ABC transporter permease [Spirochaetaceae bacterium]
MDKSAVKKISVKKLASQYTTLFTFVLMLLVLSILTQGAILKWASIKNLLIAESVRAFAALGVGMIIITWGIDLSIGYVVCLTASVAASFAQDPTFVAAMYKGQNFPLFVPILAALTIGLLFGAFNGILVAYGNIHPFIATLGSMSIARGLQLIYTKAAVVGSLKDTYKHIAQGTVGPIPNLAIFVAIAVFLIWILMAHTRLGSNYYAIGGNRQAALVSGINVKHDLVSVYAIAGLLYGCAGALLASRLGLANSLTANGMELDAIAAVTVGGVSQTGGVGTVPGMIIGVLTLGLINYGMSYLGIDSYYQQIVKGAIIIIAVYFDMRKYAKNN